MAEPTLTLAQMHAEVAAFRYKMGLNVPATVQVAKVVEELGELVYALAMKKETLALDGVIDAMYALLGTAQAAGFDAATLASAWAEVHRSNMTKIGDGTLSPRGADYQPPRLETRRSILGDSDE